MIRVSLCTVLRTPTLRPLVCAALALPPCSRQPVVCVYGHPQAQNEQIWTGIDTNMSTERLQACTQDGKGISTGVTYNPDSLTFSIPPSAGHGLVWLQPCAARAGMTKKISTFVLFAPQTTASYVAAAPVKCTESISWWCASNFPSAMPPYTISTKPLCTSGSNACLPMLWSHVGVTILPSGSVRCTSFQYAWHVGKALDR